MWSASVERGGPHELRRSTPIPLQPHSKRVF
jgi:hypothetical protein